ncbi:hypothetical protein WMY93_010335 [Mugilogobius chulae]|uniref:Uncharacterized protein n=1 Tax=Mugilogobius chulae TaxID=88201 RepID=A0AAW0PCS1_9GOBI
MDKFSEASELPVEIEIELIRENMNSIEKQINGLREKVSKAETSPEQRQRLEEGYESLKDQNRQLKSEFQFLTNQPQVDRHCAHLKAEIDSLRAENETIRDRCAALPVGVTQKEYERLQDEVEDLKRERSDLIENWESVSSQLPKNSLEEQWATLKEQKDQRLEENMKIRENISDTVQKLAQEPCWKEKCEVLAVTEAGLEKENKLLSKHFAKITKVYNKKKSNLSKYQERLTSVENWKAKNEHKEKEISKLEKNIIEAKVVKESFRQKYKEEEDLKLRNKKLENKRRSLIRTLIRLKRSENKIVKVETDTSEVRQENCELYRQILILRNEIAQRKLKKSRMGALKYVRRYVMRRRDFLKEKIAKLRKELGDVDAFRAESEKREEEIRNLYAENDKLQAQCEELHVENVCGKEC